MAAPLIAPPWEGGELCTNIKLINVEIRLNPIFGVYNFI